MKNKVLKQMLAFSLAVALVGGNSVATFAAEPTNGTESSPVIPNVFASASQLPSVAPDNFQPVNVYPLIPSTFGTSYCVSEYSSSSNVTYSAFAGSVNLPFSGSTLNVI